jgi:NAD(P)H-flavin reductase
MDPLPAALSPRGYRSCKLLKNTALGGGLFLLDFAWPAAGPEAGGGREPGRAAAFVGEPKAGQFFLVRPKRSSVFLGRPLGAAFWERAAGTVRFLIAPRGRGTEELSRMGEGEEAELTGPLGNAWEAFLPPAAERIALVGGGAGAAPLLAFAGELAAPPEGASPGFRGGVVDFYAGFRTAVGDRLPGLSGFLRRGNLVIATEDGSQGKKGLIPDFLEPADYDAVFACGPEPMLRALARRCKAPAGGGRPAVPCFVSLERRMACGVGACLGCTVRTAGGSRRCCADGPIFPAEEVFFED